MKNDEISNEIDINEASADEVFLIAEKDQNSWEEEADETDNEHVQTNIRKDLHNVAFLMFLYVLQGVPLGLVHTLPFIMSSRNVSYADQGTFSFAIWPYSMKLLWAPFVDSIYLKRFGRRKSWLVPMQFIMGVFMITVADYVHELLEVERDDASLSRGIWKLTVIFWILTFFTATQDVAVDGWGLTILSKENVSWSSTCNSAGVTLGWFIGGVIFLLVQSANFSNQYFRPLFDLPHQEFGIVTIDKFMKFFGAVFLMTTTLIMIFKKESVQDKSLPTSHVSIEDSLTLKQTYKIVWRILCLPAVRSLGLILFTCRAPFALHHMIYLKLIEKGVPRENLGLLAVPLTPFEIVLPLIVSRFTNGPEPLKIYLKTFPLRIISAASIVLFVYLAPFFRSPVSGLYPFFFYVLCICISIPNSAIMTTQSVAQVAFFTRVSDKTVGGTYMTLLNTISNIGAAWPQTLALYLVHLLSIKQCIYEPNRTINDEFKTNLTTTRSPVNITLIAKNNCYSELDTKMCGYLGGTCIYKLDAYYVMAIVCAILGVVWIAVFGNSLRKIQSLGKASWKIKLN